MGKRSAEEGGAPKAKKTKVDADDDAEDEKHPAAKSYTERLHALSAITSDEKHNTARGLTQPVASGF